jgi:16S rRNA (cytosine967-C5)-methyltransferase
MVKRALTNESETNVIVDYGQNAKKNSYEAVLLDSPCSGLGSVRRKPESRWRKQPSQLPQLTTMQAELLQAGIDALKPGGYLLYSTCSPLIQETNTQVRRALDKNPGLELVDAKAVVRQLSPELELNQNRKTVQLWTHEHSTDAMFMAIFRKP